MVQKIILANCCRLIKAVTSKIIIDDWMQRKRINDALPADQRRADVENSIEELQLPMFQSAAIGCLHEVSEAFIVSKCPFVPVLKRKKKFSNYRLSLIRTVKQIIIADNSKFLDMFSDATLATYHRNRATTEVKDIRLVQGYDV